MGRKRNHRDLADAYADEASVRVRRTIDDDPIDGFVVALGDDWVVLHVHAGLRLRGWTAVHLDAIRDVKRTERVSLLDRALAYWEERPENPQLDPSSDARLLRSAAAAFPLVALHEEVRFPGVCAVGLPLRVTAKKVDLLDLSMSAKWADAPRRFALKHVTRIDLGGDYLVALQHIAGSPPATLQPPTLQ